MKPIYVERPDGENEAKIKKLKKKQKTYKGRNTVKVVVSHTKM